MLDDEGKVSLSGDVHDGWADFTNHFKSCAADEFASASPSMLHSSCASEVATPSSAVVRAPSRVLPR
jgi:hypothetical protein